MNTYYKDPDGNVHCIEHNDYYDDCSRCRAAVDQDFFEIVASCGAQ